MFNKSSPAESTTNSKQQQQHSYRPLLLSSFASRFILSAYEFYAHFQLEKITI